MEKKFEGHLKVGEFLEKAGPVVAVVLLAIFLTIKTDKFLTIDNFMNIARQSATNGFIALGMLLAILTAGIDLSVGSVLALSTIIGAKLMVNFNMNPFLVVLIILISGAILGLLNGVLLTYLKLPHPFISTLGTQNIYRGICLTVTAALPITVTSKVVTFAGGSFLDVSDKISIPVSLIFLIIMYLVFGIFLKRTVLGRSIYAVGGNLSAAKLSGINTKFVLNAVYAISGLMCGVAGLINIGRVSSAYPLAGFAWETDAIAAVIIGGASFFGGKGTVLGTFFGVLLISMLRNGLNLLSISPDVQTILLGVVIVLAVFIDVVRNGGFKKTKSKKLKTV